LKKPEKWKTFINLDARIDAFNKTHNNFKQDNLVGEVNKDIKSLVDKDVDLTKNIESWGFFINRLTEEQKIPALRYAIDQTKLNVILSFIKAEYEQREFAKMGQDFIYATFALAYASSEKKTDIVDKILEEIDQRAKKEYDADKYKEKEGLTYYYESDKNYNEGGESSVRRQVPFCYPEEVDTSIYALFMLNTPVPIEESEDKKRPIEHTTDDNIKKKIKEKIDKYTKIQRKHLKSQYKEELIEFGHRKLIKIKDKDIEIFNWVKEEYDGEKKDKQTYKERLEKIEKEEAAEAAGTAPAGTAPAGTAPAAEAAEPAEEQ